MKRILWSGLMALALLAAASCAGPDNLRKMNVHSGRVTGIRLPSAGQPAITLSVQAEVDNPAGYVKLSDISGVLHSGKLTLGTFTADDFSIEPRMSKEYAVKLYLTPDSGLSFFTLMGLLRDFDPDDYVFDLDLRLSGSPNAKGPRYKLKDLPASLLLGHSR